MRFSRQTALDKAASMVGRLVALGMCILALKFMRAGLEWLGFSEQVAFWVSCTVYSAPFFGLLWFVDRRMQRRK